MLLFHPVWSLVTPSSPGLLYVSKTPVDRLQVAQNAAAKLFKKVSCGSDLDFFTQLLTHLVSVNAVIG